MALPSNPQSLASYDITKGDQAKIFVKKVADLFLALSSQFTSGFIAGLLNGSASLFNTANFYKTQTSASATSVTVDCVNACGVAVLIDFTAVGLTLTLTHLAPGVPVMVAMQNTSGSTGTFSIAATNPAGVAYPSVFWKTSTNIINMTSTGISMVNNTTMIASGSAITGSNLWMVAN